MKLTVRIASLALVVVCSAAAWAQSSSTEWNDVEKALGRHGNPQPGGVYKFGMPRSDLHVTVQGVAVKPALALGSWLAFKKTADGAMAMGDLVLTQDEVEAVMLKLQQSGIEQTALHNHLLFENPRVMYMHVFAHGDAVKLAQAFHDALALTKTPAASPAGAAEKLDLDQAAIEAALGRKGNVNGGVLQFGVPRAETIQEHGTDVPASMGMATSLNFQPTGNGHAAITGDFVLVAAEVNPVIKVLRENGILVTALHSHMLDENPRLFFMHFWANADAVTLARNLRKALDHMHTAPPPNR